MQSHLHLQAICTFQNEMICKYKIFFGVTFNDLEPSQNLWYGRFQFHHCDLLTWEQKEHVSLFWFQIWYELELQNENLMRAEIKKIQN